MAFSGTTFTKLFNWLTDPQRNEKIFNSRLDDEFGGIATGLTTLATQSASVIGSFTRDISLATGTQAITGAGFKPRAVIFLAGSVGGSSDNSAGIDDGTNHSALVNLNALAAGTFHISAVLSIRFVQSGSDIYGGIIQSLDTDGFTISWTKTGSPTGTRTILFLAFR